jgi:hypothetical protein
MAQVHNETLRMPAVQHHEAWLRGNPAEARSVLAPYPSDLMVACRVVDTGDQAHELTGNIAVIPPRTEGIFITSQRGGKATKSRLSTPEVSLGERSTRGDGAVRPRRFGLPPQRPRTTPLISTSLIQRS